VLGTDLRHVLLLHVGKERHGVAGKVALHGAAKAAEAAAETNARRVADANHSCTCLKATFQHVRSTIAYGAQPAVTSRIVSVKVGTPRRRR